MATTSLWHINGRLGDLVAYVENPEKTERPLRDLDDLWAAAGYIQRPEATEGGRYVTAINCLAQTAVQQMIATKRQYSHVSLEGKKNTAVAMDELLTGKSA